jgi:ribosome-associated toxin RatA of RatAB toxin-antitoxin module
MAQHSASVTVNAPVHQVYQLYTHFNDYPKFMTFVKEVTYLDGERSHWVVDVVGEHAWDAVNDGWVPDQRIGWRSVDGLKNSGTVTFEPAGTGQTRLTVDVAYEPPAGLLGMVGEALGVGGQFERRLQHDLTHFATMVEQAPPGALDPTSSAYLFHAESADAGSERVDGHGGRRRRRPARHAARRRRQRHGRGRGARRRARLGAGHLGRDVRGPDDSPRAGHQRLARAQLAGVWADACAHFQ